MNIEASVYLPVLVPSGLDHRGREQTIHVVEDLCSRSGHFHLVTDWPSTTPITIQKFDQRGDFQVFANSWHPIYPGRPYIYLRFASVVDVDVDAYCEHLRENNPGTTVDPPDALMFARDLTTEDLSRRVADVVIAANIASPGSLHTDERVLIGDDVLIHFHTGFTGLLPEAVERASVQEWPPISTVEFSRVWEWLNALPGFKEGQGKGRLGRAVSAFSYLMSAGVAGAPTMGLMWALVGLEALYAKGN